MAMCGRVNILAEVGGTVVRTAAVQHVYYGRGLGLDGLFDRG